MAKKTEVQRILEQHNKDLLDLNKRFIGTMARPRPQSNLTETFSGVGVRPKKKLSQKQLSALAQGRKKLAARRSQINV